MAWQKDKLVVRLTFREDTIDEVNAEYIERSIRFEHGARVMERFGDDWGKVWIVRCLEPIELADLHWYRIELRPEEKAAMVAEGVLTQEEADQPSPRYADVLAKAKVYWDDAIVTDLLPQLAKRPD